MLTASRWLLSVACLTVLGLFAVCSSGLTRMVRAADPPKDPPSVTVYDPDPKHLWNRLHEALCERLEGEGIEDPGQLDPFLWEDNPYWETGQRYKREKGENYKRAVAVLDEFIAKQGDKLITDPRKRALLQRDLWALFDLVGASRYLVEKDETSAEMELARRVAKILPRLALTADQIKALPDNYAEAVAAKKFPGWFEAGRLWDADGPWVLLGTKDGVPLAQTHVELFGGRSAFFVFLRLPEGREQTLKYVAKLGSNEVAPKVPVGYFALVRQMQLIDDRGRITLTPVMESLQFRGLGEHEFKLNRKEFIAGKPSLAALGPEDRERNFIALLRRNAGPGRPKVLSTCTRCHAADTMQSHVRHLPPLQFIKPRITTSKRDDEALHARIWKKDRYEWGLLQGLTLTASGE